MIADVSKGAWPFSTRDHGWPIADCTGEGLTAALAVRPLPGFRPLDEQRYCDASTHSSVVSYVCVLFIYLFCLRVCLVCVSE